MASLPFAFDVQFFTNAGAVAASHKLYTYEDGTTTPKATYTDATGTVPNSNPITLDTSGRCSLWIGDGSYSFELRTAADVLVKRWDGISTGATSAADLSFIQSGSGAVTRTVTTKLRETVSAADFGAVGDGSDESGKLASAASQAAAAGLTLVLDGTKTYSIGSAITLPANLRVRTNGAVLNDLTGTTSNSAAVTISSGCDIDYLKLSIPAGIRRDRAIRITGTNVRVSHLELTSSDQQSNTTDLSDAGVTIASATNVWIGQLVVSKYDRTMKIDTCTNVTIDNFVQSDYSRGTWILDSAYVTIRKSRSHTLGPNATLSAGNNAFLIGCDTVGASHDILLEDATIEAAGEHAIRVGGPESIRNVRIVRPTIKGPGACGIKMRGTDGTGSIYNYNIVIDSPIIEDCGTSTTASTNRCGILAEWVAGLQIIAPTIRQNANTYCASFGIRVNTCNDVEIDNPTIHTPQYDGILIHADEGDISRFKLVGGFIYNAARHGLNLLVTATRTVRNIRVSSLTAQSCTELGVNVTNSGSVSDAVLDFDAHNNTTGACDCDTTNVVLKVTGAPGSTAKSSVVASNGSTWLDQNAGMLYVLSGGTWTAVI